MRFLSPTLLAAQKESSSVPFVKVTVNDLVVGVPRLRWERLYTGGEPDRYHAAVMPGDGSLLRARVDPAGPSVAYQRVASPGPSSDFGSWTDLGSSADAGLALAASGASVVLAFVTSAGTVIQVRESADYGASYGPPVTAVGGGAAISWLAAALKSDGTAFLLYAAGSTVYTLKRTGGVWGTPVAWPYSVTQITGLAVAYAGDYHLAIAAVDTSGDAKLWTAIFGDGFSQASDTWSALRELASAEGGSNVDLRAPGLAVLDTHRLFFVEEYTGSVAYARPQWTWFLPSQTFAASAWREPVPFDLSSSFGLAITGASGTGWLSAPFGVWRASPDAPELDVSDDVLELVSESRRSSGRARVVLRNDDGRYNDLAGGPAAVIRPDAELTVSPGYVTSVGQEISGGPRYWIDGWEHTSVGGEATLTLSASDAWSLVQRWRARRQFVWPAGSENVPQILGFILGRADIELVDVGSSALASNHHPAFTIHPGEDGLRVVRRLLATVPDVILAVGELALLFEPLATDSAVYTYGTDHPILRASYVSAALPANRAQVFGEGLLAEEFNWSDIADQFDRLRQVHDLNITSVSLAQQRAAATLRQEELSLEQGELVTPVNCGQELYDVVSVTDPRAGLSAATYRIVALSMRYVRRSRSGGRSPAYEQRLTLGRV